jgi:glycosyltransferase involved in cell wall biosynthesis
MNSLVSIIIPTYNRFNRIVKTLDSVFEQTYQNLEVIVVDDGSTDNTLQILNEYNQKAAQKNIIFKVLKQEHKGAPAARNKGLYVAAGEYIIFFDSDDIMLPNRVEEQINLMETDLSDCCACGFSVSPSQYIYRPYIIRGKNLLLSFFKHKLRGSTQSWMFKKSIVIKIGGYDESLDCRQDLDIVFRMLLLNPKISISQKILSVFVYHNEDKRITHIIKGNQSGYNSIIKYNSKVIIYCVLNKEIRLLFLAVKRYCEDIIFTFSSFKYSLLWKEFTKLVVKNQQYTIMYQLYILIIAFVYFNYYFQFYHIRFQLSNLKKRWGRWVKLTDK